MQIKVQYSKSFVHEWRKKLALWYKIYTNLYQFESYTLANCKGKTQNVGPRF